MADGYLIGPDFLGRIRRTVDAAEAAPMRLQTGKIPVRLEGEEGTAGKAFRICTFTGSWSKNTDQTIRFKYQMSTPNTIVATNIFANIASGDTASSSAYANCAIAKDGTAWFVIAAECDPPAEQVYE